MLQTTNLNTGMDWRAILGQTLEHESSYTPAIEGKIPTNLKGILYRNGPGRFDRGDHRKENLLDGDGMIQAFHLFDGTARYKNRFVQTQKYLEEESAGKFIYETWSTRAPGGFLSNLGLPRIKSQAGVTAVYRNDKLYAFDEVSSPYILDGDDLSTLGSESIGSIHIRNYKAHTKINAKTGDWILFGTEFGKVMKAQFIIQSKTGEIKSEFSFDLPRPAYMHDFFETENYVILNLQPCGLNLGRMLLGIDSFIGSLNWKPEKGNLLVVMHKSGAEKPIVMEAPTAWMWHSYNAYEVGNTIIADFIGYEKPDHFLGNDAAFKTIMTGSMGVAASKGTARRYEIDLKARTVKENSVAPNAVEFPAINLSKSGQNHRYGYTSMGIENNIFHSALARIDFNSGQVSQYDFGDMCHIGEPIFAPDPTQREDESKGWLLALGLDARTGRSFLSILDACSLESGPVATLHLNHHTPLSFHGFWRAMGA
ncbi:MAG: carotenoid oxygenase family protein [Sneathiella sp.]|nr:carotenoid oxygenase family protein [Sneathiella sp.]